MQVEFRSTWTADYMMRAPACPRQLYILLHGFSLRGEWIFRKLEKLIPGDAAVLAPSGPFPLIQRKKDSSHQVGYSWYFYNKKTDEYLIDMRVGSDFVVNLVRHLELDSLPTTLIGFSQGGFLAPFIAAKMPRCTRVLGIATEYLVDEMAFPIHFRMDQIHGEKDEIVLLSDAQKAHLRLKELGVLGSFYTVDGLGHQLDQQVRDKVREIIDPTLA